MMSNEKIPLLVAVAWWLNAGGSRDSNELLWFASGYRDAASLGPSWYLYTGINPEGRDFQEMSRSAEMLDFLEKFEEKYRVGFLLAWRSYPAHVEQYFGFVQKNYDILNQIVNKLNI